MKCLLRTFNIIKNMKLIKLYNFPRIFIITPKINNRQTVKKTYCTKKLNDVKNPKGNAPIPNDKWKPPSPNNGTNQNKWPQTLTTASFALSKHMLHSNMLFCSSLLSFSLLSVFFREESDSLLFMTIAGYALWDSATDSRQRTDRSPSEMKSKLHKIRTPTRRPETSYLLEIKY
ncbi:hypothetical protein AGLY_001143 [Aphis glycines]|uniref:Uncharacterized protein n=1 Tax=Aphis glycines TaxID=307491 RepID=A0A6G0UA09_APHGL|nr:hypothetical protein AGLY_001143 [Aphis glycines]